MTVTTVGYGDVIGKSMAEIIFQIIMVIAGTCIYSWIISSVSNYVKKMNERNLKYEEKVQVLEEIKLNSHINKKLYNKIIRSEIMEKVMTIDNEANQFEYPYKNTKILKEIEDNCFLVPFPAEKYFGYTDKISLKIYLNCAISPSNMKSVITDIDNKLY